MENTDMCPCLGLRMEVDTCHMYPSRGNFCHAVDPPERIQVSYQAKRCLTDSYQECPIYSSEKYDFLPNSIAANQRQISARLTSLAGVMVMVFVVVLMVVFRPFSSASSDSPAAQVPDLTREAAEALRATETPAGILPPNTSTPTARPVLTDTPTRTPARTPTWMKSATPVLSPTKENALDTATPFPSPGPELGERFGPEDQFLIHTVQEGQSFAYLERVYETTRNVIEATNDLIEGASLWSGTQLVILPGVEEVPDLPRFRVIFLDQPLDLVEIAGKHNSTVEGIRYHNELGPSPTLEAGRWLIIPLEE